MQVAGSFARSVEARCTRITALHDMSCLPVFVFDAGYPKFTLCDDGCKHLAKPYLQQAVASDSAQSLVFVTK